MSKFSLKNKIIILFISLFAIFSITGCNQQILEGEIYNKQFVSAEKCVIMIPMIHSNGQVSYTTMIPVIRSHPDEYIIYIKQTKDNILLKARYYVSKEVYDECKIGMWFVYDEERGDLSQEPVEQTRQ